MAQGSRGGVALRANGTTVRAMTFAMRYGINSLPSARVVLDPDVRLTPRDECVLEIEGRRFPLVVSSALPELTPTGPARGTKLVDPLCILPDVPIAACVDESPVTLLSAVGIDATWVGTVSRRSLTAGHAGAVDLVEQLAACCKASYWRSGADLRLGVPEERPWKLSVGRVHHGNVIECSFGDLPEPGSSVDINGCMGRVIEVMITGDHQHRTCWATIGELPVIAHREPPIRWVEAEVSATTPLKARIEIDGKTAECAAQWVQRTVNGGKIWEAIPIRPGDRLLAGIPAHGVSEQPLVVLPFSFGQAPDEHTWGSESASMDIADLQIKSRTIRLQSEKIDAEVQDAFNVI